MEEEGLLYKVKKKCREWYSEVIWDTANFMEEKEEVISLHDSYESDADPDPSSPLVLKDKRAVK